MLQRIRHPNVLLYMGSCVADGHLTIITELVENSLESLISDPQLNLSLSRRLQMARDCAMGLGWMHGSETPVVHGDISPKHFYLDYHQKVKICEFGWDRDLDPQHTYSPRFTAPEVLKGHTATVKSDIFSFGMLLLFIVTQKVPYSAEFENDDELRAYLLSHPNMIPNVSDLPPNVGRLVSACLVLKPSERPNMRQILKVMDVIMIDTSISDPSGKKFWRKHFFQRDEVLWKEIESTLWQCYLPTHVIVDTSSQNLQLKQQINKKLLYFRGALVAMKFATDEADDTVFMERFGFVLQYFGPLINSKAEALPFLTRLYDTLTEDWFFGTLDQTTACGLLSREAKDTFLVRYSTTSPGYFTISKKCGEQGVSDSDFAHWRIKHEAQSESYTIQDRTYGTLPQLINSEIQTLSLGKSCPGSPYAVLRLEERDLIALGYMS